MIKTNEINFVFSFKVETNRPVVVVEAAAMSGFTCFNHDFLNGVISSHTFPFVIYIYILIKHIE